MLYSCFPLRLISTFCSYLFSLFSPFQICIFKKSNWSWQCLVPRKGLSYCKNSSIKRGKYKRENTNSTMLCCPVGLAPPVQYQDSCLIFAQIKSLLQQLWSNQRTDSVLQKWWLWVGMCCAIFSSQFPFLCPTNPYLACRLGRIAAQLRQFWGSVWITQPPPQGCLKIYTTSSKLCLCLSYTFSASIVCSYSKEIFICRCLAHSKEIMSKLDRWYFGSLYCHSDHLPTITLSWYIC